MKKMLMLMETMKEEGEREGDRRQIPKNSGNLRLAIDMGKVAVTSGRHE